MLYELIISPIETIVEWVFLFITKKFTFVGVLGAIIGVSLIINFLALPLYNIADDIKEKENQKQKQMEKQIKRIKSVFKGDERFMMLQTYYNQNNYRPLEALKGSLSILIEIPFFIAAYHYLSNNELLKETVFHIGSYELNLGVADHLFKIGPVWFNILPFLMTAINLVSGNVYTKNAPKREKIQIYSLAAIFLIILYESPSGLLIYWICNNLFSLGKNIVQKQKNPKKKLFICLSAIIFAVAILFSLRKSVSIKNLIIVWLITFIFILSPFIFNFFRKKFSTIFASFSKLKPDARVFLTSAISLALLCGLVLPSVVIASSPIDFACLGKIDNPALYIFYSLAFFTGLFVLWPFCIYKMFGDKVKTCMTYLFGTCLICALCNTYLFSFDYGIISQIFTFETLEVLSSYSKWLLVLPILVFIIVSILWLFLTYRGKEKAISSVFCIICIAEVLFGGFKTNSVLKTWKSEKENLIALKEQNSNANLDPVYHLSKDDKNVIIIFLDRGINLFIPDIIKLYPELEQSFDGFVYYPNTVSFGDYTVVGAPAMLGGYEYTPENMNERSDELLVNKHDESLLVMPKLFLDAGWNVTLTDPPLPGYSERGNLSLFKSYPEINVSDLAGRYTAQYLKDNNTEERKIDEICKKQCRNFCLLETLLPWLRLYFYNIVKEEITDTSFEHYYSSLYVINDITDFDAQGNSYIFIENDATHPYSDQPDWGENLWITDEDIRTVYNFKNERDLVHFRVNALCMQKIGEWLDYLKENDVYDNSRILIISDHGRNINFDEFADFEDPYFPPYFEAMLFCKDFDAHGVYTTDTSFMTNADTLFIAKEGLDLSSKNPFTGNDFKQEKDSSVTLYPAFTFNQGELIKDTQFILQSDKAWTVHDNIFEKENWERLEN